MDGTRHGTLAESRTRARRERSGSKLAAARNFLELDERRRTPRDDYGVLWRPDDDCRREASEADIREQIGRPIGGAGLDADRGDAAREGIDHQRVGFINEADGFRSARYAVVEAIRSHTDTASHGCELESHEARRLGRPCTCAS